MQLFNRGRFLTLSLSGLGAAAVLLASSSALAATYKVGPSKPYASLDEVAPLLEPGDVVEVDGGATYAGDVDFDNPGTAAQKITIRGIPVNGQRPVLEGGARTVAFNGDHYVFEGFEVTGGTNVCVFHHADDITLRDMEVHDCPGHGVLGADEDSGSLLMEYVEVYGCGSGDTKHQIYIATDEYAHPGSVFRMQHSFVHHGNGGNNVKSRAERNEIYYNWIEGAYYHEIELIGPDGQDPELAREDSDVVGNVFVKTGEWYVARIGGDGTGETFGRYRFANNTFLLAPGDSTAIRMFDGIESVEMHNNAFYRLGGGGVSVYTDGSASWATGQPVIAGVNNWIPSGSEAVPAQWAGTRSGSNPGFVDVDALDLRPSSGSALVNAGGTPVSPSGHSFSAPLAAPKFMPPAGESAGTGSAAPRTPSGKIDIGAYELGQGPQASLARDYDADLDARGDMDMGAGSCAYGSGGASCSGAAALAAASLLAAAGLRRRA